MAYELFLNVVAQPSREEMDRALAGLDALEALRDFEVHELEDIARSPEEYVEDLEWLISVEPGFRERFRAYAGQHGLNGAVTPMDPAVATRFMEALGGFDFLMVRFPGLGGAAGREAPEAIRAAVARGYMALARFARSTATGWWIRHSMIRASSWISPTPASCRPRTGNPRWCQVRREREGPLVGPMRTRAGLPRPPGGRRPSLR